MQIVLFEVVEQLDPQVGAPGRTVADIDGTNKPSMPYRLRVIVHEDEQGRMTGYDLKYPDGATDALAPFSEVADGRCGLPGRRGLHRVVRVGAAVPVR